MVRIILCGCNGQMGKAITNSVAERSDCEIVAGIDINTERYSDYPVFKNINECDVAADLVIDFSHPSLLTSLLTYCKSKKYPVVIATTGLSEEQKEEIAEASKEIPVFFSANMSIGVSLISELAKKAAKVLSGNFDIEIVEMHHNKKIDAPSGTALMLADSISQVLDEKPVYEYNRHAKRERRSKNEIGIHAVRGGTIVGEHEVIFAGHDEIIKISHSARSKEIFAVGAVNAGIFIADKEPGLYAMADFVSAQ